MTPGPLIRLAYGMSMSRRYQGAKRFFHRLLSDPHSRLRAVFDTIMIVLVMASVILLIYEDRHPLGIYGDVFESGVITVFIIEYLLRMWLFSDNHRIVIEHYERAELVGEPFRPLPAFWAAARRKLAYVATPMAIIDLLAILPSYRAMRILRLFLLFRLIKLFRYARNLSAFGQVLVEKRFELYTLSAFVGSIVLVAAVAMYLFEAGQPNTRVVTLMDAVYWAVITITTVGYGDVIPVTAEGRGVAMVLVFVGIGVISFATSIVVMAFHEKMRELHDSRVFSEVRRLDGVTIVCGFGRIGQEVAARLKASGQPFVVIDRDESAINLARKKNYLALSGDATDTDVLAELGLGRRCNRILCLTHDDVSNVFITLTARQVSPDILIISRANKAETVSKLERAGASHVVRPYEVVARMAAEFIGQPVAFDALSDVLTRGRGVRLEPVPVTPGSWLEGRAVGELALEDMRLLLFGVLRAKEIPADGNDDAHYELPRKHFYFNPIPGFRLQGHDLIVVIGYESSLQRFKARVGTKGRTWLRT